MRAWLAALALAGLVCGCGGEKGGEDSRENMDLKEMTAHLRELKVVFFFFFTLVTGPRSPLNLTLSDRRVYEPHIRARHLIQPPATLSPDLQSAQRGEHCRGVQQE